MAVLSFSEREFWLCLGQDSTSNFPQQAMVIPVLLERCIVTKILLKQIPWLSNTGFDISCSIGNGESLAKIQPRLSRPEHVAVCWDADKFLSFNGIICRNSCKERAGYSWLLFAVLWDLTNSLQIESFDLILLCMQHRSSAWICGNLAFAKLLVLRIGYRPGNQALKPLN